MPKGRNRKKKSPKEEESDEDMRKEGVERKGKANNFFCLSEFSSEKKESRKCKEEAVPLQIKQEDFSFPLAVQHFHYL